MIFTKILYYFHKEWSCFFFSFGLKYFVCCECIINSHIILINATPVSFNWWQTNEWQIKNHKECLQIFLIKTKFNVFVHVKSLTVCYICRCVFFERHIWIMKKISTGNKTDLYNIFLCRSSFEKKNIYIAIITVQILILISSNFQIDDSMIYLVDRILDGDSESIYSDKRLI